MNLSCYLCARVRQEAFSFVEVANFNTVDFG